MERGASHGHALDPAHTPACALPLSKLVSPLCGAAPSPPGPRPEPTPCPPSLLLTSHYPDNLRPAAATRRPPFTHDTPSPPHLLTCLTHTAHHAHAPNPYSAPTYSGPIHPPTNPFHPSPNPLIYSPITQDPPILIIHPTPILSPLLSSCTFYPSPTPMDTHSLFSPPSPPFPQN